MDEPQVLDKSDVMITPRIPRELREWLKKEAHRHECSLTTLIIAMCEVRRTGMPLKGLIKNLKDLGRK